MFDGVSLDQLRTFIAAADEGSFSAAAKRAPPTSRSLALIRSLPGNGLPAVNR
jgi:hypothetical protein